MSDVEGFMNEAPRNGRGQYLMADENGKVSPRTRATTFAKAASDHEGLTKWKVRTTLAGIARRADLYAMLVATNPSDRDGLNRLADEAFQAGDGQAAANNGTALHDSCEQVARGLLTIEQVAEPIRADVIAYFRELARHGLTENTALMERSVLTPVYNVGGTFDRVYTWHACPLCGCTLYIGDIKTGRNLKYGEKEFAVQLADYANAEVMFEKGSAENFEPMPAVCKHMAIIVHVPHGQGQAFAERIDIQIGWWAARLCAEVRAWRSFSGVRSPLMVGLPEIAKKIPAQPGTALPEPWQHAGQSTDGAQIFTAPAGTDLPTDFAAPPVSPAQVAAFNAAGTNGAPVMGPNDLAAMARRAADTASFDTWSEQHSEPQTGIDPFAGMPAADPQADDEQPPWDQHVEPTGQLIGPKPAPDVLPGPTLSDEEADQLAQALMDVVPKSKAKPIMQAIARDLDPNIKIAQWAINIAKDTVRHPLWLERSAELIEKHVPAKHRKPTVTAMGPEGARGPDEAKGLHPDAHIDMAINEAVSMADPVTDGGGPFTVEDAVNAEEHAHGTGSAQADQIVANVQAIRETGRPITGPGAPNPFEQPEPEKHDEAWFLAEVEQATSKRRLAALWQQASDEGVTWTPALNAAGVARMNAISAQL